MHYSTCSSKLPCQNGGYTDPKTCNTCRCPSGLTGTFCDTPIQYQNSNCGTLNLNATGTRATLSQSGFGYCNFIIQAPVGQQIAISVDSIRFNGFTPCESNYVEIKYGWDIGNTGARFCSSVRTRQFVSATNTVLVLYRNLGTGSFSITYSAVSGSNGGGGQTTQPPQTTTTRPWWLTTTQWCAKIEAYKMILGIADDFQNSMTDVIEEKRSLLLQKIDELVTKKRSNKKH
uniref:CUB domain-containing protein n=1 Tax=Panagrolaimus davidi TaxID=227884 RepID=A0A914PL38_9BILA